MTLVGMLLGMAFLRLAASWQPLVWAAFWALTALHVWANVRAMRCLLITGINQARAGLLLRHYLCQVGGPAAVSARCQVPVLARLLAARGCCALPGTAASMRAACCCSRCCSRWACRARR